MLGGKTMAVVTTLMNSCDSVKENGPTLMADTFSVLPSVRKNMQLVIIVRKSSATQQLTRWTRVKLLRVGRRTTDTHMWSLVSFLRIDVWKRWVKVVRSSSPATGRMRSTAPSSSSTASQRLQRKKNLRHEQEGRVKTVVDTSRRRPPPPPAGGYRGRRTCDTRKRQSEDRGGHVAPSYRRRCHRRNVAGTFGRVQMFLSLSFAYSWSLRYICIPIISLHFGILVCVEGMRVREWAYPVSTYVRVWEYLCMNGRVRVCMCVCVHSVCIM